MNSSGGAELRAPWSARRVAGIWDRLAAPGAGQPRFEAESFEAESADRLPAPVRRWLVRAIEPGTPLATTVVVSMTGRIRIGAWRPFSARQVVAAGAGYIWAASVQFGPLRMLGFDRYSDTTGEMSWRLGGLIPVVSAKDSDVTRSAAGRLASELVLTPAAALSSFVRWEPVDDERTRARVTIDGSVHVVTIAVDETGMLRRARLPRWGNPDGKSYSTHEFIAECGGERSLAGYRLPAHVRAGWDLTTAENAEAFIEFNIDSASFR